MFRCTCAFLAALLALCVMARGGLVEISPLTTLSADASSQIAGGDNGASDQKQQHNDGTASNPAAVALALASVSFGGSNAEASATANASFDVTNDALSISGLARATVPGASPVSSASAQSAIDLPFTIHGDVGRFDFSIDVSSSTITGDSIAVTLDRVDAVDPSVIFEHVFTQSYAKHFIDRLEPGAYRLTVDARASSDSADAGAASELDSVSYQLAIARSDVPHTAIPLPVGIWFGMTGLVGAALLVGSRRLLGWFIG